MKKKALGLLRSITISTNTVVGISVVLVVVPVVFVLDWLIVYIR